MTAADRAGMTFRRLLIFSLWGGLLIPTTQVCAGEPGHEEPAPTEMGGSAPRPQPSGATDSSDASVRYTAGALRDPMNSYLPGESDEAPVAGGPVSILPPPDGTPQAPSAPQPPAVTLRGILWGGREPQAIIEEDAYGLGDTVQGGRIVSIDAEGVVIELEGHRFRLTLDGAAGALSPAPGGLH